MKENSRKFNFKQFPKMLKTFFLKKLQKMIMIKDIQKFFQKSKILAVKKISSWKTLEFFQKMKSSKFDK